MYDLNIYFIQNTIFMLRELESLKPIRWLNQGWVSSRRGSKFHMFNNKLK